jgi:hypothetical protein
MASPLLGTLLGDLIDYAGLFPPAKLPLEESIRNYARYRRSNEAWMLSRFICPVARLGELDGFADLFEEAPPFLFSALGQGGDDSAAFASGFEADLGAISTFHQRHPGRVRVDAFEVRLPTDVVESPDTLLAGAARAMSLSFDRSRLPRLQVALEVGVSADTLGGVMDAIRAANAALGDPATDAVDGFGPLLVKLRLGGVTADAFPSVDAVAAAIVAARDRGVPLKLTAGLHHPLRHLDPSTRAMMHGFLNVYTAGVFAAVHELDVSEVRSILADEDPKHFEVTLDSLSWGGRSASAADIARVRRSGVTSYGSCSFDEPREDLAVLGLLPEYSKPS